MKIVGRLVGTRSRLSCREVGRLLQSFLDDELGSGPAAKVAAHLEDCRRCGIEAETYAALRDSLRRRATALPAEPAERLRAFGERLVRGELDPGAGAVPC